MLTLLCSFGHIASYSELLERFHGQESAVLPFRTSGGVIHRARPNVYVCSHLDDDELAAARVGAPLDCVTVLRRAGALAEADRGDGCLHLRLRKNDGRASARRWAEARTVRAHWTSPRDAIPRLAMTRRAVALGRAPLSRLELPVTEALRQALTSCLPTDQSRAVLETLLGWQLSAIELANVIARTPRHVQARIHRQGLPAELDDALARLR